VIGPEKKKFFLFFYSELFLFCFSPRNELMWKKAAFSEEKNTENSSFFFCLLHRKVPSIIGSPDKNRNQATHQN
jgi:hypothetical protein